MKEMQLQAIRRERRRGGVQLGTATPGRAEVTSYKHVFEEYPLSRVHRFRTAEDLRTPLQKLFLPATDRDRVTVKLLSETTALAAVEWIRRRADGDELERLVATYAFFKGGDGWRIVMVTVHPSATVGEFE